jgi:hypothetical protein
MTSVAVSSRSMKNIPSLRIGLGVLAALTLHISGNLYGAVVYEDNFSANPGALNGRTTASGFGNWTTSDNAFQVGNGTVTVNSNSPAYHAATFALPTLTANDTLSLTITVRASAPVAGTILFGFTPNANEYVINNGYGWVYNESSSNPNIQVFKGQSVAGQVYSASLTSLNFNPSLPTTFQYTYSASAQTLSLSATNGVNSSTLLNNLDMSAIPLSGFSNFAMQFQDTALGSDSNPAYVDYLKLEVVPEPSTCAMLLCGLGAMTALCRRRR